MAPLRDYGPGAPELGVHAVPLSHPSVTETLRNAHAAGIGVFLEQSFHTSLRLIGWPWAASIEARFKFNFQTPYFVFQTV